MAHCICGALLVGLGFGIGLLCMPILPTPLNPLIGLLCYVGIVAPVSILCGRAIGPLTRGGFVLISAMQFGIVEWLCFQNSKRYLFDRTGSFDMASLVIAIAVTMPLAVSHCLWLKLLNHLWKPYQTKAQWRPIAMLLLGIAGLALIIEVRDFVIAKHVDLTLDFEIPADIPESVPAFTKSHEPYELRLRELYPSEFVAGWKQSLEIFLLPERSGMLNNLKALPGYLMTYQSDGSKDCKKQLAALCAKYDTWTVRRILRRKYGSDSISIENSVARLRASMSL